jgi:hypothetical protein
MFSKTDSRTSDIRRYPHPYVNSSPIDSEYAWGQPPASKYRFRVEGTILHGDLIEDIYLETYPPESNQDNYDIELLAEFESWEAASDEDMASIDLS